MVVNGKLVEYDLSRFKNCTIKSAALCDLMGIPDFASALSDYESDVTDTWVADMALYLSESYKTPPELREILTQNEINQRRKYQRLARQAVQSCRKSGLYGSGESTQENRI